MAIVIVTFSWSFTPFTFLVSCWGHSSPTQDEISDVQTHLRLLGASYDPSPCHTSHSSYPSHPDLLPELHGRNGLFLPWARTNLAHVPGPDPFSVFCPSTFFSAITLPSPLVPPPLLTAGSQQTRPYPWQGHEGENLTGKADQVFRGFEKASSRDPTHDKVSRRKPDRQGRSGFRGFWKSAPGTHLKDDICLSDACLNRLLPNFCDTGRRPSPLSSQIRINLELFSQVVVFYEIIQGERSVLI